MESVDQHDANHLIHSEVDEIAQTPISYFSYRRCAASDDLSNKNLHIFLHISLGAV